MFEMVIRVGSSLRKALPFSTRLRSYRCVAANRQCSRYQARWAQLAATWRAEADGAARSSRTPAPTERHGEWPSRNAVVTAQGICACRSCCRRSRRWCGRTRRATLALVQWSDLAGGAARAGAPSRNVDSCPGGCPCRACCRGNGVHEGS